MRSRREAVASLGFLETRNRSGDAGEVCAAVERGIAACANISALHLRRLLALPLHTQHRQHRQHRQHKQHGQYEQLTSLTYAVAAEWAQRTVSASANGGRTCWTHSALTKSPNKHKLNHNHNHNRKALRNSR